MSIFLYLTIKSVYLVTVIIGRVQTPEWQCLSNLKPCQSQIFLDLNHSVFNIDIEAAMHHLNAWNSPLLCLGIVPKAGHTKLHHLKKAED